jgi:hypothetical protein
MRLGFLKLRFSNDGDGTGKLSAEAEAEGFAGKSSAYFDINQIEDFAVAISEFPLPDRHRCSIASGFVSRAAPETLEQEHLGIQVYPVDRRGHIGVQVRMSTPIWNETRPDSQKVAKIELLTTYEPLGKFSTDLRAMIKGTAPEAMLEGEMLP